MVRALCRLRSPRISRAVFARDNILGETIAWAVPCISGRGRRIAPNLFGALVATHEEPRKMTFVTAKGRGFAQAIDLDGSTVTREPKFLSENLVVFPAAGKGPKYLFVFPRSSGVLVEEIVQSIQARASEPAPVVRPDLDAAAYRGEETLTT